MSALIPVVASIFSSIPEAVVTWMIWPTIIMPMMTITNSNGFTKASPS